MNSVLKKFCLCLILTVPCGIHPGEQTPDKTGDELWADALRMIESAEEGSPFPPELAPALERAAEKGSVPAMCQYAYLMHLGHLPGDEEKILKYLLLAAERNSAFAQFNLGMYYRSEKHQDFVKAFQYFTKAYQQKHPGAGMQLGKLYFTGKGCTRDYFKAREVIMTDAFVGNCEAQNAIGVSLVRGEGGLERDYGLARQWFEKSAKQGYAPAMNNLGVLCRMENSIGSEKRAFAWFMKAIEANAKYAPAYRNVADCYSMGSGVDASDLKALEYAEKGAALGDAPSMHLLGMLYSTSDEMKRDMSVAFSWYLKAAECGYQMAQYRVAEMYADGVGTIKDSAKAEAWKAKAEANKGYFPDLTASVPEEL